MTQKYLLRAVFEAKHAFDAYASEDVDADAEEKLVDLEEAIYRLRDAAVRSDPIQAAQYMKDSELERYLS